MAKWLMVLWCSGVMVGAASAAEYRVSCKMTSFQGEEIVMNFTTSIFLDPDAKTVRMGNEDWPVIVTNYGKEYIEWVVQMPEKAFGFKIHRFTGTLLAAPALDPDGPYKIFGSCRKKSK